MGASAVGNGSPNTWSLMYIKMPLKLAKLAACALDKNTILICGGIYGQSGDEGFGEQGFQYINSVYKLDLNQTQPKWFKQPKMIAKRTHYGMLPVCPGPGQGQISIYTFGGSADGSCESITFPTASNQSSLTFSSKWKAIKSYVQDNFSFQNHLELNDLQTFCLSN
jgi:hypothetical protein